MFLYEVGDSVMIRPIWEWSARDYRLDRPVVAEIVDRRPRPPNRNFPLYLVHNPARRTLDVWITEHDIVGLSRDYREPTRKYLNVISSGPLIYARIPIPSPRWSVVMRALTEVMRTYGLRQKDIFSVESMTGIETGETARTVQRLDAAFSGDADILPKFALYDWRGDRFVLLRAAT